MNKKDKAEFIQKIFEFIQETQFLSSVYVHHLAYKIDDSGNEYMYVFVGADGSGEKRINISGDNCQGILSEFMRMISNWQSYPYILSDSSKRYES